MWEKKICKSCVLPESNLIKLDAEGNCKLCGSESLFKHILVKPDIEKLEQLISKIKKNGEGREFDCIVAWSGGRDSTHMLHELVEIHNLRCLAVFAKTPFTPEETINNVQSISKLLNVKLIEFDTPANHIKIASYCLDKYFKTNLPILINLACAPCKYTNREIFKIAKKNGIKSIIYGGNRFEYIPFGPASVNINSSNRYSFFNMVYDAGLRFIKGIKLLFLSPALIKYINTLFKASILYINQYSLYFRLKYPDILCFDYFHYADWDEEKLNNSLKKLNWKLPPGCNSTWRADCIFEAVKNTVFKEQLGFSYAQAMYSNLIRAGKITREAVLKRLVVESISESRLKKALELCKLPADIFNKKGRNIKD